MRKDTNAHSFRPRTPDLHANFTKHLRDNVDWHEVSECNETQIAFDIFYVHISAMFDNFYPMKTITTTSRDPPFITPEIKVLLRRKNRLMRNNQIQAANAIAKQIHNKIQAQNAATFSCKDTKELWQCVNRVTGKTKQAAHGTSGSINANLLNSHYARISTNPHYVKKLTCGIEGGLGIHFFFNTVFVSSHMYPENPEGTQVIVGSMNMGYISDTARNRTHNLFRPKREPIPLGHSDHEFQIFKLLDELSTTSPGTDGLPHWFLRIAAPSICTPIAHLFNLSLTTSIVPDQWKTKLHHSSS